MFVVAALEAALNLTVPLYIQIVWGRTSFDNSLAMMPPHRGVHHRDGRGPLL